MASSGQILTAAQMRAAEAALIACGETESSLMDRAGRGAAAWVYRMAAGRAVTVLCGPGNNGGDGYVIARVLAERGVPVTVVAPLAPTTEAAKAARAGYRGVLVDASGSSALQGICHGKSAQSSSGGVLVDCLFGTGLARMLDASLAGLLGALAMAHPLRIAVDLPSGTQSDSAALLNHGLTDYHLTLALGAWKWAHWLMPAAAKMGELRLVDIGIGAVCGAGQIAPRARLHAPAAEAHKYTRGLLAVVGGTMPGAARLAARAAMHGGAGYVKLLADAASPDELVVDPAPLPDALADQRLSAMLVGPGLGRGDDARGRLRDCLASARPLVIDADALHLLGPAMLTGAGTLILTPHAGELTALYQSFGIADTGRLASLSELARVAGAVVVAKGPDTLIAAPDGAILALPRASSWLSTAGTGDVLAGLIASRLAARDEPMQAASIGCQLHAAAARRAGPAFNASTLIDYIPAAYASFL